jgi:hypothetical protein
MLTRAPTDPAEVVEPTTGKINLATKEISAPLAGHWIE